MLDNCITSSSSIKAGELDRIYDFLKVEKRYDISAPYKKTNPRKLSALIENYDEMKSSLSNTEYEVYLD